MIKKTWITCILSIFLNNKSLVLKRNKYLLTYLLVLKLSAESLKNPTNFKEQQVLTLIMAKSAVDLFPNIKLSWDINEGVDYLYYIATYNFSKPCLDVYHHMTKIFVCTPKQSSLIMKWIFFFSKFFWNIVTCKLSRCL